MFLKALGRPTFRDKIPVWINAPPFKAEPDSLNVYANCVTKANQN
jgi:hypothetical protein